MAVLESCDKLSPTEAEGTCTRVLGDFFLLVERSAGGDPADRLAAVDRLSAWCEAQRVAVVHELDRSGQGRAVDDSAVRSPHEVEALRRRAAAAHAAPEFAAAMADGQVSAGHLDQLAYTLRRLDGDQRSRLLADLPRLLALAREAHPAAFGRILRREERRLGRAPSTSTLEEQQRAVRLHRRTDRETGMRVYTLSLDPVAALALEQRLDAATEALFHDERPPFCPDDPIERQAFLRAHALLLLLEGRGGRSGQPEIIVVVDTTAPCADGAPEIDWGLPVEIPHHILLDLFGRADVHTVIVRNGVVLHAPGRLDLGRTTRLANRAQRRALRAVYPRCALPGCEVRFNDCKIHHVVWWRHGGFTDLANLLPLCWRHHRMVHLGGCHLQLHPDRTLTITEHDGRTRTIRPPRRGSCTSP
jgi:hypothetical protein